MILPRVWNKHHGNAPAEAIYVGRGSQWGNPFKIGKKVGEDRTAVIERYRCEVLPTLNVRPLRGKHLVCYCSPAPCHADLLLEAANAS